MLSLIREDIRNNIRSGLSTVIFLANFRVGSCLQRKKKSIPILWIPYVLCVIVSRCFSFFIGCSVPFAAKIGKGIVFQHGLYGIFISSMAEIGDGCTIFHHVTIGSNFGSKRRIGAPRLGDGVLVGAGAILIGPITVGSNVSVAAGSIVYCDIAENSTYK